MRGGVLILAPQSRVEKWRLTHHLVNFAPLKFLPWSPSVAGMAGRVKEFTKRGRRPQAYLRNDRVWHLWGQGVSEGDVPDLVHFFLPEASTRSQAPYLCKNQGAGGAACVHLRPAPEWRPSRYNDLLSIFLFLSPSFLFLFFFFSLFFPFPFSSFLAPFQ